MKAATLKINIWVEDNAPDLPDDYADLVEMFAPHAEHVAEMCRQGYQSGEICDEQFTGWWTIRETESTTPSAS